MKKIAKLLVGFGVLTLLAGCASQPAPVQYPDPPPRKRADAKSDLEYPRAKY